MQSDLEERAKIVPDLQTRVQELESLRPELAVKGERVANLLSQLTSFKHQSEEIRDLQSHLHEAQKQLESNKVAQATVHGLQSQVDSLRQRLDSTIAENKDLQRQAEKVDIREKDLKAVQEQLNAERSSRAVAVQIAERSDARVKSLEQELSSTQGKWVPSSRTRHRDLTHFARLARSNTRCEVRDGSTCSLQYADYRRSFLSNYALTRKTR